MQKPSDKPALADQAASEAFDAYLAAFAIAEANPTIPNIVARVNAFMAFRRIFLGKRDGV